ncbi:MAG TPA: VOC family protein [Stellaceae bacterium]|nr:VOC family protein [Stellaceae bacterium]
MNLEAQLGYLGLEVSDIEAWRRFATEMLGLSIAAPRPDGALPLRMDGHDHRFLLHQGPADDAVYIGWEVADTIVLGAARDKLVRAGIAVRAATDAELESRGVQEMFHFEDPNGIRIEIFQGPALGLRAFRSSKIASGFKTGTRGMGHVLINAKDVVRTERFYRDVLGFRLTDYVDTELMGTPVHVVFLHVNPRHHSLAFAALPFPKRLNHVMFETNSLDDVGASFYRAQDIGVPIALNLGRHQNDRMVSFYGVTPSGFWFEIGWGAREVDDETWEVKTYHGVSDWGHRPVAVG